MLEEGYIIDQDARIRKLQESINRRLKETKGFDIRDRDLYPTKWGEEDGEETEQEEKV
jgi:hypothetical protein